jgi:hypothetical protein
MRNYIRYLAGIFLCLCLTCLSAQKVKAQLAIIEAVKALTKKVIKAIDLQIQRMQNNTIDLQNVQKQLENTLSKLKLEEIANWTEQQKELYREYFDELWRVKSILNYYRQFNDIVNKQKQLFEEYKRAYNLVGHDRNFSEEEIEYMYGVYAGILEASIANVDDILVVMQSFSLQMSDAERLEMINKTNNALDEHLAALRQFNQRNQLLSLQRTKSKSEIEIIKKLYGIE